MLFAPNLSMLWADLLLADRFERRARAGFSSVELWWPGPAARQRAGRAADRRSCGCQRLNLLTTTAAAAAFAREVARPSVRLQ